MAPSCKLVLVRFSAWLRIQDGAECGNDRSALDSISNDMYISSMRDGEGGADDRGEKVIVGGAVGPR